MNTNINTSPSIFIKKSEMSNITNKYSNAESYNNSNSDDIQGVMKTEIIKSIPSDAIKKENVELQKTKIEWRWRLFKFPNTENGDKEAIEISYIKPNSERLYINKKSKWVNMEIGKEFDNFVVDQFYHYTDLLSVASIESAPMYKLHIE